MGFVYIIQADWEEYSPYEKGERFEDEEEAIEGCTLEDVGCIKVPFESLMPVICCYLRPDCAWVDRVSPSAGNVLLPVRVEE